MRSGQDQVDTIRTKYKNKAKKLKAIIKDLTGKLGNEIASREAWAKEKDALLGEIQSLQQEREQWVRDINEGKGRSMEREEYKKKAMKYKEKAQQL